MGAGARPSDSQNDWSKGGRSRSATLGGEECSRSHDFTSPYRVRRAGVRVCLLPSDRSDVRVARSFHGGRDRVACGRYDWNDVSDGWNDYVSAIGHVIAGTPSKE